MRDLGSASSMKTFRRETLGPFGNVSDRPEAANDPDVSKVGSCAGEAE